MLLPKRVGAGLMSRLWMAIRLPMQLLRVLRSSTFENADIYVVHDDPVMGWIVWWWARRSGARFIYRICALKSEMASEEGGIVSRLAAGVARYLRNLLMLHSDVVVPMSQEMARVLATQTGLPAEKMHPIVSTVQTQVEDGRLAQVCDNYSTFIAKKLESRKCTHWLAYVGSLNPGRDLRFLIDTLIILRRRGVDAGLLVLGVSRRREYRERLQAYARDLGASQWIVWNEPVPEVCLRRVLAKVDIGLSPFPPEGVLRTNSPLKTLEYIRAGLPVVASPIPDNITVINESGAGLIAEYTPEAFAAAAHELLAESPSRQAERTARAMKWLAENRDLKNACALWDEVLSSIMDL